MNADERPVDDVVALVEATREEPVEHLESRLTERDEADLQLLHAAGVPQHARPSRRSADALGRLLLIATVLAVLALAVIIAGEIVGTDAWRQPIEVACWVLIAPGLVMLLACVGTAALAGFEGWYERRRGGGSP